MHEFELTFVESEAEAKAVGAQIFLKLYDLNGRDDKALKQSVSQFLTKVNDNITTKESSASSKLMSLYILRDVVENSLKPESKVSKLFNAFLAHKLLRTMEDNCMGIDPMKLIQEKGKTYFPGQPEIGNSFIRVQLELVKFLAAKFPKNKNNDVTNFMKAFNKLQEKGVIFPNSYQFISHGRSQGEETGRERKVSVQNEGAGKASKEKQFEYLCNRTKIFLQTLEEEDEEQELQKEINKMHEIILKEGPKLNDEGYVNEIMQSGNEELITKLFEMKEFMDKEVQVYDNNINSRRNVQAYIDEIKPEGYKIFPKTTSSTPKPSSKINRANSKEYPTENALSSKFNQQPPKASAFDPKTANAISRYFQQVEERSKSPITSGFRKINQSLSREKAVNATTIRSRVSPLNKTNLSKSINSLKGSKIAAIFTNPPNPSPPSRHYQGQQIPQNYILIEQVSSINKHQGHRRFVTSNFKAKGSIFENEHLQIGFKSEAIYEEVSGFRVLLKIELYFGNLSQETLMNLRLDFKGDQNVLLYANPREIERIVSRGEQNKIDLVVIPLKPEFPLLKMLLRYEIAGKEQQTSILLPNSALKFTHFMEMSKGEFLSRWSSAELYKTKEFALSYALPPDTLHRWIPSLTEQSSFSSFVVPGNKKDYQLFTSIVMMQKYEALLKINVRPNLKVVMQLGVEDRNEEALGYYKTFMQHLEQFMTQHQ